MAGFVHQRQISHCWGDSPYKLAIYREAETGNLHADTKGESFAFNHLRLWP